MTGKMDPMAFAKWLLKQWRNGCGYLMGAVGQKTAALTEGSWLVQQYRGSREQFEQAKRWLKEARRVFDCQGLADCYISEKTGTKVNVYARNNYSQWCSVRGKGKIPKKYRVPGAAVFMHSQEAGRITHVGFLAEPVDEGKPEGDWYVVEARGVMHGVVRTRLKNRAWNRWGLMDKYFDYGKAIAKYHPGEAEPQYALGDRTLKKGRVGEDVRTMQEILAQIGYEVEADGVFGDETVQTVKEFKISQGLTANGIYGAAAHGALMEMISGGDGEDSEKSVRISAAGTWNVRKGPGTGYGVVTVARQGMEFGYVSTAQNGWIQIEALGGTGWVSPKCAEVR